MLKERAAGVLLAVSSLPSPYGIGSFGAAARKWLDFLKAAGQRYWQILPLGPTGWGDSPYQSFSAFAISPYYVDLDLLVETGLLAQDEAASPVWGRRADQADYAALYRRREKILRLAFARFAEGAAVTAASMAADFRSFCEKEEAWLGDYALFMTLKKKNHGRPWLEWEEPLRRRDKTAMTRCRRRFAGDIAYHSFVQFLAFSQWAKIRDYANALEIAVIGDMPIYTALDSADTWAQSGLFQLGADLRPVRVAGCPPDPFSASGQLWGNPLYRWDVMADTGFAWWISRLRSSFSLYDVVRIDHFRGLESYYSIDAAAADARGGEWVQGPGLAFIQAVHRELPGAAIIAEDLGYLTAEVKALLAASGYPGMKIIQFAFDSREASDYMPYTYSRNCVVYPGTHDNDTALGWFKNAPPEDAALAMDYFGLEDPRNGNWAFIRAALSSAADTAIIPMQDYLGIKSPGRMNTPSTTGGNNWRWRMASQALEGEATAKLAERILHLTRINRRCPVL